jgi:hypothetical protein
MVWEKHKTHITPYTKLTSSLCIQFCTTLLPCKSTSFELYANTPAHPPARGKFGYHNIPFARWGIKRKVYRVPNMSTYYCRDTAEPTPTITTLIRLTLNYRVLTWAHTIPNSLSNSAYMILPWKCNFKYRQYYPKFFGCLSQQLLTFFTTCRRAQTMHNRPRSWELS